MYPTRPTVTYLYRPSTSTRNEDGKGHMTPPASAFVVEERERSSNISRCYRCGSILKFASKRNHAKAYERWPATRSLHIYLFLTISIYYLPMSFPERPRYRPVSLGVVKSYARLPCARSVVRVSLKNRTTVYLLRGKRSARVNKSSIKVDWRNPTPNKNVKYVPGSRWEGVGPSLCPRICEISNVLEMLR